MLFDLCCLGLIWENSFNPMRYDECDRPPVHYAHESSSCFRTHSVNLGSALLTFKAFDVFARRDYDFVNIQALQKSVLYCKFFCKEERIYFDSTQRSVLC